MKQHPYSHLPDTAFWSRGVAAVPEGELDPVVAPPFLIDPDDKVATAGSCFAQHIGRHLGECGCTYLVTEKAHPILGPAAARRLGYGVYSARYGNIYTARQLRQTFERAFQRFTPHDRVWAGHHGGFIDPFRPSIEPEGFGSERELAMDRERHLAAVRTAFETLDVFVFTLGLTEAWMSRRDGAVYPISPGVVGGRYSAREHVFVNFGVEEVVADMEVFLSALRGVNRRARVVLTVSPVPLAATAEPAHVLVATTYSKSVLRVACETLRKRHANVAYFPSYEIVASGFAGAYFEADRRTVSAQGVAHVMRVFARSLVRPDASRPVAWRRFLGLSQAKSPPISDRTPTSLARAMELACDEEALDLDALSLEKFPAQGPFGREPDEK